MYACVYYMDNMKKKFTERRKRKKTESEREEGGINTLAFGRWLWKKKKNIKE